MSRSSAIDYSVPGLKLNVTYCNGKSRVDNNIIGGCLTCKKRLFDSKFLSIKIINHLLQFIPRGEEGVTVGQDQT